MWIAGISADKVVISFCNGASGLIAPRQQESENSVPAHIVKQPVQGNLASYLSILVFAGSTKGIHSPPNTATFSTRVCVKTEVLILVF